MRALDTALSQFGQPGWDLGLERLREALEHLGRPQDRLPPVVHIAGTNGKGSTLTLLKAMAQAAGKRVHAFLSPPLMGWETAILPASGEKTEAELLSRLAALKAKATLPPLTAFEAATLLAFCIFAAETADLCLLEVGLGGRDDATNLASTVRLSLLTPIAMDHADWIGPHLADIAWAKAGILRPGVPALSAPQAPVVADILHQKANTVGAPLRLLPPPPPDAPVPARMPGPHQKINLALAQAAAEALALPADAIAQGAASASLPGRLSLIGQGPDGQQLFLDGAHNEAAFRSLADWIRDQAPHRPITALVGVLADRDAAEVVAPLLRVLAAPLWAVDCGPGTSRWRSADDLARVLPGARAMGSLSQAVRHWAETAPPGALGIIAGSLSLAAPAMSVAETLYQEGLLAGSDGI